MKNRICVDLYTDYPRAWMVGAKKTENQYGVYYTMTIQKDQLKEILRLARVSRVRARWYEERWARSSTYRNDFFREASPPYYCRYCHRLLSKKYMVIDHIVPVGQTKKSSYARSLLTIRGIQDVNDIRNLAPSCSKCNRRKSDKMGVWVLRGWFGDKMWFRVMYPVACVLLCMGAFALLSELGFWSMLGFL